jgi:hypothetical protein
MIETVIIVLTIAKLKSYNIREALKDWSILLVLFTALIYVCLQVLSFNDIYDLVKYSYIIKIGTFVCYFIMAYKHKLYKQIIVAGILVILGSWLNTIVMNANNGLMPIFPDLTYATGYTDLNVIGVGGDIHVLGNINTKLIPLADIFDFGYMICSIGDLIIRFGMGLLLYNSIKVRSEVNGQMD